MVKGRGRRIVTEVDSGTCCDIHYLKIEGLQALSGLWLLFASSLYVSIM
jgi:hypothetical protein